MVFDQTVAARSVRQLRPRVRWGRPAAASALLHLALLAGLYCTADLFPPPEGPSVAAVEVTPNPTFSLDVGPDDVQPEQTLASSAAFDPAVAQSLAPSVEPLPSTGNSGSAGAPERGAGAAGVDERAPTASPWFPQADGKAGSVVFVVDRSGSMGQEGRFRRACRELRQTIEALPGDCRFQILAFNRFVERPPDAGPDLTPATDAHKRRALAWLESLAPEGGTDSLPALRQAVALDADLIYFVTDGDDLPSAQALLVTRLNHGRSSIHAVCLAPHDASTPSPLAELAHANGGTYRSVDAALTRTTPAP